MGLVVALEEDQLKFSRSTPRAAPDELTVGAFLQPIVRADGTPKNFGVSAP